MGNSKGIFLPSLPKGMEVTALAPGLCVNMHGVMARAGPAGQGLTLVHFSVQRKLLLWDMGYLGGV